MWEEQQQQQQSSSHCRSAHDAHRRREAVRVQGPRARSRCRPFRSLRGRSRWATSPSARTSRCGSYIHRVCAVPAARSPALPHTYTTPPALAQLRSTPPTCCRLRLFRSPSNSPPALTGSRELPRLLRIPSPLWLVQTFTQQRSPKPPLCAQAVPRGAGEALRAGLVHTQRAGTRPRPETHTTISPAPLLSRAPAPLHQVLAPFLSQVHACMGPTRARNFSADTQDTKRSACIHPTSARR